MIIFFKDSPHPFTVDFKSYLPTNPQLQDPIPENLTVPQKVHAIATAIFKQVQLLFNCFVQSAYLTASYSGVSFKHIVLGYYGSIRNFRPPANIYLMIFRIGFWIFGMGESLVITTFRKYVQNTTENSIPYIKHFSGDEIDIDHIKTNEIALDTSKVPSSVKVDQLADILASVNFSDPKAPGYMPETTRKEGSRTFTKEELKDNLATFISRVNNRTPFLLTPPAYDTPRLMAYYQQIEDAVRLSIHKVTTDLQDFKSKNGEDITKYNEATLKTYKDLLEANARLAIDLAIAAVHCGARYMGDAMTTYSNLYGEAEGTQDTLQGSLIEVLAQKRKKIAQQRIQVDTDNDAHSYGKYMQNMGGILGIPGTKNIYEQLASSFELDKHLNIFFKHYTVDCIIETVQEKIKTSQKFRELITDWIQDQVNDWKKAETEEMAQKAYNDARPIIDDAENIGGGVIYENIQQVLQFIEEVKKKNPAGLKKILEDKVENVEDFVNEFFGHDLTKELLEKKFSGLTKIARSQKIQKLKQACNEALISSDLFEHIKNIILNNSKAQPELFHEKVSQLEKINKIQKIIQVPKETLLRVLNNEADLLIVIQDFLHRKRKVEFLEAFALDGAQNEETSEEPKGMQKEGISKELMEWLLVSQKILLPQQIVHEVQKP